MSNPIFHFTNPPLTEVVLGVQFAALANFTSGHMGWFRTVSLGDEWSRMSDALSLPDQYEIFETQDVWSTSPFRIKLESAMTPRLQIMNSTKDRLIQLQASRFIYNWQKKDGVYPHYHQLLDEFQHYFAKFCEFARGEDLGEIIPNQWEVTYVDKVPRGELWSSPSEWHRVLPGLLAACNASDDIRLEGANGEWHYEIMPHRGRLHIAIGMVEGTGTEPLRVCCFVQQHEGLLAKKVHRN